MDNNQTFLNACRNGQKSIVQIFLKKGGIDINKRDQEGNTALYYACQKGYRDIVALLLDNDADASCINNRSESPLHAAARSGNKEILGKLLQKGADINVTDNEGRTPLICPVSYTHLRAHETLMNLVCRLLLEKKKTVREKQFPGI